MYGETQFSSEKIDTALNIERRQNRYRGYEVSVVHGFFAPRESSEDIATKSIY
jgi:hypothetical protein